MQAGIKIELVTDSESIELEYFAPSCYSGSDTIDIYADNLAVGVHNITGGKGKASFKLESGEKRVTVYLPIDTVIGLKSLTVDGKWRAAKPRKRKLLAIGDSITQGYGAKLAGSTYINSLYRKTDFEILSQGIGGFRYEKGSIMPIDNFKPDRILVALGTNYHEDMSYDYERCIEEFYESFLASHVSCQFEKGNPQYIAGLSGIELAETVFVYQKVNAHEVDYLPDSCSDVYWAGWALAYFQW